jgi:hypothetical protein
LHPQPMIIAVHKVPQIAHEWKDAPAPHVVDPFDIAQPTVFP